MATGELGLRKGEGSFIDYCVLNFYGFCVEFLQTFALNFYRLLH